MKMSNYAIVLWWDWKESPGYVIEEIAEAVLKFERPAVVPVNTDSDAYAAVIGEKPLSKMKAASLLDEWLEKECPDMIGR